MTDSVYPPFVRKLPLNPKDGDAIADLFGNIFEYNGSTKTWNARGLLRAFQVVTEQESGLVSPEIYSLLKLVQDLIKGGTSFEAFKIRTDSASPYYYYFYSSDRLIAFTVEKLDDGSTNLRIEVDKARLFHNVMSRCCVGCKGPRGEKGDTGKDGTPAAPEEFQTPVFVQPDTIKIDALIGTPIETDISVRLFRSGQASEYAIEFVVPLGGTGSTVNVVDETVGVDPSSDLIFATGAVTGTIKLTGNIGNLADWRFKARQKGAKGQTGQDGTRFLEVVTSFFDDASIKATSAVISMRKSPITSTMYLVKAALPRDICVSDLSPSSNSMPIGGIREALFCAVAVTMRSCKPIWSFLFAPPDFTPPPLDLPNWQPASCCVDLAHYQSFTFDWFTNAETPLPFEILLDPPPPEQCCQAEFFWCPNVGDGPCGIQGDFIPPERGAVIPVLIEKGGSYTSGSGMSYRTSSSSSTRRPSSSSSSTSSSTTPQP